MSRPAFLPALGFLMLAAWASPVLAGDTTYSETRAVPREDRPSGGGDPGPSGPVRRGGDGEIDITFTGEDGEERSLGGVLAGGFFKLCGKGLAYGLGQWATAHGHLFAGDGDMQALAERPWRFGWGFGFGGEVLPGAAGGIPFAVRFEALRTFDPAHLLRLRIGAFGSMAFPAVDYARTAYTEGRAIGVQQDHIASYSLGGIPATLELLHAGRSGLYLAAGGGVAQLAEEVDLLRSGTWGTGEASLAESRAALRPLVSLAVGRFDDRRRGRMAHSFEIRYQAILLLPERRSSFPGDNAEAAHSLTWEWSWLW